MGKQVWKLISFGDVAGGLGMLEDGWKVWETLRWPCVASWRFSLNSASKQGTTEKPIGCTKNLQDSLYFYRIQPREKWWVQEVMEGLGNVVSGWNWVIKFLVSLKTQNQSWEMDGFAQKAWRSFLVKWWNWWGFNDQEIKIQIGWGKFCY